MKVWVIVAYDGGDQDRVFVGKTLEEAEQRAISFYRESPNLLFDRVEEFEEIENDSYEFGGDWSFWDELNDRSKFLSSATFEEDL